MNEIDELEELAKFLDIEIKKMEKILRAIKKKCEKTNMGPDWKRVRYPEGNEL